LDVEKRKNPNIQIVGYFISLSGFKETTIEQEKTAGGDRVILLDGAQVVDELIEGRIITPIERAMERAGRCAAGQPVELLPKPTCELLAHDMGWIWVVYFTQNKQRTHFALIHSDGESIATALAETIIEADKSVGGDLHLLNYLPPSDEASISDSRIDEVKTTKQNTLNIWIVNTTKSHWKGYLRIRRLARVDSNSKISLCRCTLSGSVNLIEILPQRKISKRWVGRNGNLLVRFFQSIQAPQKISDCLCIP
jgi:hypothetical protein